MARGGRCDVVCAPSFVQQEEEEEVAEGVSSYFDRARRRILRENILAVFIALHTHTHTHTHILRDRERQRQRELKESGNKRSDSQRD